MKISKEVRRTSRQLFRHCMVNGKLDESRVRMIVDKIIATKPRGYHGLLDSLAAQVRNEIESQRAVVESASPLTVDIQSDLNASLSRKYGRELALEYHIKPELLGGIRVKVGSDVWDGSVKARLESLKASLS
jgi:F-type H+-transporting ATPase subunit delta